MPLVYDEVYRLAREYMRRERKGHTLSPTDVLHAAFMKLRFRRGITGETHFKALLARAMYQVLVDYARQRGTQKKGGGWVRLSLTAARALMGGEHDDFTSLHEALHALAAEDARAADMFWLSYLGFTQAEIAEESGVSERTVRGDIAHAQAWLRRWLGEHDPDGLGRRISRTRGEPVGPEMGEAVPDVEPVADAAGDRPADEPGEPEES